MTTLLTLSVLGALALGDAKADEPAETDSLQLALQLPVHANTLRAEGVSDQEITEALEAADKAKLNAGDTAELMRHGAEAGKSHGNIDNFGTFVQSKLDEGLRGRELAQAIRAEHRARGKGGEAKGKSEQKHGREALQAGQSPGKSGSKGGGSSSGGASKGGGKSGGASKGGGKSGGSSGGSSKSGGKSGKGGVR